MAKQMGLKGMAKASLTLLAVGVLMTVSAGGQQPALVANAARPAMRPVAQVEPAAPASPEPPQATAPVKDDLFAGTEKFAKGASDVTEVTMDPDSLDMVNGTDARRAHRMVLNVVRTYSYDKPGMYNPADVDEYRHKLEGGDWHCSVHIRELKSGDSTDVCSRRRPPDMIENAIITASPKSLTFIHNIRRINGQGGAVDGLGFEGLALGLPIDLSMSVLAPEMQADILASTAEMRAEMPDFARQMHQFKLNMPLATDAMSHQLRNFKLEVDPQGDALKQAEEQLRKAQDLDSHQNQEIQRLQDQIKQLQKQNPR